MIHTILTLSMFFAHAASEADIAQQLKAAYDACQRLYQSNADAAALRLQCQKDVHKKYAKKFCEKSAATCQSSLDGNGFGFMDPKRCVIPGDCSLIQEDGMQAVSLAVTGKNNPCNKFSPNDPENPGLRAELTDPLRSKDGEAIQYDVKMKVPSTERMTNISSIVVMQLHADNDCSPPMAIRLKKQADGTFKYAISMRHNRGTNGADSFVQEAGVKNGHAYEKLLDVGPTGSYQDISIQAKPGPRGQSFLKVLIGGKPVFDSEVEMANEKKKCAALPGPAQPHCELGLPYFGYNNSNYYMKIGPYDYSCKNSERFDVHYAQYKHSPMATTGESSDATAVKAQ